MNYRPGWAEDLDGEGVQHFAFIAGTESLPPAFAIESRVSMPVRTSSESDEPAVSNCCAVGIESSVPASRKEKRQTTKVAKTMEQCLIIQYNFLGISKLKRRNTVPTLASAR
jgi:hypothetical protein